LRDARGIELQEGDAVIRIESMNYGVTEGIYLRDDETRQECAVMLNTKTGRENVTYSRHTYKVPKI
jgi:hypothetical protein